MRKNIYPQGNIGYCEKVVNSVENEYLMKISRTIDIF